MTSNTLGLAGDGDDVELVEDVERLFGIKLGDNEVLDIHNVGQLYDLILSKRRAAHPATRACLTQAAFYRLRRALKDMGLKDMGVNRPITPATPLSRMLPPVADRKAVRQVWKQIAHDSGVTLPRLETPWKQGTPMSRWKALTFWVASYALVFALAIALERLSGIGIGWWLFFEVAAIIILGTIALWLAQAFLATVPRRLRTVGDLAREAAGQSFAELQRHRGGASPSDIWYALAAILRGISGHKALIDRETTFFATR